MKAVILAGGLGTRFSEETERKPKPMVEIGGKPILWHIMKIYSTHGINDFIICLGYKGYVIKEYFANYFLHTSDVTFDMGNNKMDLHNNKSEPWKVTLIDTGANTMTGGRLKRIAPFLDNNNFCMTYGDGVGDINISKAVSFHNNNALLATVTATKPPGRFGALDLENEYVKSFIEKPDGDDGWINGGFFVLSPKVIDYIEGDDTVWENKPMELLVKEKQMKAFFHSGFWHPMDTLRDKNYLEDLWLKKQAPWKVW